MRKYKYYAFASTTGLGIMSNLADIQNFENKYFIREWWVCGFNDFSAAHDYAIYAYCHLNEYWSRYYYGRLIIDRPLFTQNIIQHNKSLISPVQFI